MKRVEDWLLGLVVALAIIVTALRAQRCRSEPGPGHVNGLQNGLEEPGYPPTGAIRRNNDGRRAN